MFRVWFNNNCILNWHPLHFNNKQFDDENRFTKSQRQLSHEYFEFNIQYRSMHEFLLVHIVESIVSSSTDEFILLATTSTNCYYYEQRRYNASTELTDFFV
jgi:hypothetical protein